MKKEKVPNPHKMREIEGPVLTEEEFKKSKVRITTYLDDEVWNALRELAKESGGKYQTILNQMLRTCLFGQKEGLVARIEKLEKIVLKKKAA